MEMKQELSGACADDHKALTRVWGALGIDAYTGKSVDEHVTELKAQCDALLAAAENALAVFDGRNSEQDRALAELREAISEAISQ